MTEEKILIEIEVVQTRLKETEDNIKKVGGALKELKKDEVNNAAAIKATESELRVYNQRLKEEQRFIDATVKANTAKEGSLEQLKAQYAANTKALNQLTADEIKNTKAGQDLVAQNLQINTTLKEVEKSYGQNARNVGNYEAAVKPLKTQLREAVIEMQKLAAAGKEDSAAFKQLQADAGRMREVMDDVGESVKRLANNPLEIALNGIVEGARGVAAGFALAQSATVLFGEENEDLTKSIQQLQAAMLLLNSLSEIQQILRKESALSTLLATQATVANTVATTASAVATGVLNTSMGIAIGVMRLLGVSTVATTGAFIALTSVIAATGIGAIVLAIGYLGSELVKTVGELYSAVTATDKLTKSQSQLKMELDASNTVFERYLDQIQTLAGDADRVTQNNIDIAKSIGAGEDAILKIKQKGLNDRLAFLEVERKRTVAYWSQITKISGTTLLNLSKDTAYLTGLLTDTTIAMSEGQIKAIKNLIKINQESEDTQVDIIVSGNEQKLKAQEDYAKKKVDALKALKAIEDKIMSDDIQYQLNALSEQYIKEQKIIDDAYKLGLIKDDKYLKDKLLLKQNYNTQVKDLLAKEFSFEDAVRQTQKKAVVDLNSQVTESLKKRDEDLVKTTQATIDYTLFAYDESNKKIAEQQTQLVGIFTSSSQAINQAFTQSITETGFDLNKFAKSAVAIFVDVLEQLVTSQYLASIGIASMASLTSAESIATFGVAGIAKALLITGLIKAAFTGFKAAIVNSMEDGGVIPKAANGMLVGPSHAQGGIKISTPSGMIEAEGGEAIINKRSTKMFAPVLSAINQAGGGVKFAEGGITPTLNSQSMNFADLLASLPTPVVTVTDIDRVKGQMQQITVKSTL